MQSKKNALALFFLISLLFYFLNFTFAQDMDKPGSDEQEDKALAEEEKLTISSLGLDQVKSKGLIGASTSEEWDLLGSFYYYAPVFIKGNSIYFLDYMHSIPLNKEPASSAFTIDDVQFDLKLGLKRLVRDKWLFLGYYSHRTAIKVDKKGLAHMDILNVGLETAGFSLKDVKPDIQWNTTMGFILHNTEPFKGVNLRQEVAIDLAQISRRVNIGLDFKIDSLISSRHLYGEEEIKFRINFFSRNGEITSFFASYLGSNHPFGLEGKGLFFGMSWEQGQPPKGFSSPLSQWTDIDGLLFLGLSDGYNGTINVDLGADWILGEGANWKGEINIQGWGWILSKEANNAFYTILGGFTLYYRELFGFGFAFNHRSNHLIHQSFTNPASSINFTDFLALSKGWHMSNRKYGLQWKIPFSTNVNYFFSLGRVHSSQFVDSGTAALKYGIRFDFPEINGKITPFLRYYGESVDIYRLNNFQMGIITSSNWFFSAGIYHDQEAYGDDKFFIIGFGKVF